MDQRQNSRRSAILLGAFALLASAALTGGCTCTTCSTIGCANPNYGKKSPSMLHAIMAPSAPSSVGPRTADAATTSMASVASSGS